MAEALEALSRPPFLVLELSTGAISSLDLLAMLARRR
jgi:hypothetical protein